MSMETCGAVGLDVALKATILAIAQLAIRSALGRRASIQSALGNACLLALLLLPIATAALPRLRMICLPALELPVGDPAPLLNVALDEPPAIVVPSSGDLATIADANAHPIAPPPVVREATIAASAPLPSAPSGWRIGWMDLLIAAYLTGFAALMTRLSASLWRIARLRSAAVAVGDPDWIEGLKRSLKRLGIRRRVALSASSQTAVPVAIGWLRPTILLPEAMVKDSEARGLIDAVALHESAHIRRQDYAWNLGLRVVQALYWPHPFIWIIGRAIRQDRERACDDFCVHALGGDRIVYKTALLHAAESLARRPKLALGMAIAMTKTSVAKLADRLDWIDASAGASACRPPWAWRSVMVAVAAAVVAMVGAFEPIRAQSEPQSQPQARAQPPANEPPKAATVKRQTPGSCEVTVVDHETKAPLAGVTIRYTRDFQEIEARTDAQGRAVIPLAGRKFNKESLNLDVWDDNHVQQRHYFSSYGAPPRPIPDKLTIALRSGGQTHGGIVRDEEGRPIAGVKVRLWGHLAEKQDPNELVYMIDVLTDANGRWITRGTRRMKFLSIYLEHPDFLSDIPYTKRRQEPPSQALRDGTDVQAMTRGVAVEGRVIDNAGAPIVGASIVWTPNSQHLPARDLPKTVSDAQGRFRFAHLKSGQGGLIAQAKGYGPGVIELDATPKLGALTFQLPPARTLSGRLVDPQGKPIADAFVNVDSWRGYRCLEIYLFSDAEGRFRWENAPADEVLLNIRAERMLSVNNDRVTPGAQEQAITLKPALTISGSVVDVVSKTTIPRGTVLYRKVNPQTGEKTPWAEIARTSTNESLGFYDGGVYAALDASAAASYQLQVSAIGYKTIVSPEFSSQAGRVTWDLAMEKSESESGKAVGPGDRPVSGASVFLVTSGNPFFIKNGSVAPESSSRPGRTSLAPSATGPDGSFQLPKTEADYILVALNHEFFGAVSRKDYEKTRRIVMQPWSRVEGVARIGSKPQVGAGFKFRPDALSPRFTISSDDLAKTDAQGRFVFEKVPPGMVSIRRDFDPERPYLDGERLVQAAPGATASVEIGGRGRPVIGRLTFPENPERLSLLLNNKWVNLESDKPQTPYPLDLILNPDPKNPGAISIWQEAFKRSEAGQAHYRDFVNRAVVPAADGSFRFEDVPAGDYLVRLSSNSVRDQTVEPKSTFTIALSVPAMPGGRSDEPLDLGQVPIWTQAEPAVGAAASDFAVTTVDGRKVTLADYRGRYLLLDFGSASDVQSRFQTRRLRDLLAKYAQDQRLAVLSLLVDRDVPATREFIQQKKQSWPQAVIGPAGFGNLIARAYNVVNGEILANRLTRSVLINPDGKIVYKGGANNQLRQTLATALDGRP